MMTTTQRIEIDEIDEEAGSALLILEGDLDYSIYAAFKRSINDLVEKGIKEVTYDISRMEYMQSLGLGIIMWSYVELEGRGGSIRILGANDRIRKLFEASQLDTLVNIV